MKNYGMIQYKIMERRGKCLLSLRRYSKNSQNYDLLRNIRLYGTCSIPTHISISKIFICGKKQQTEDRNEHALKQILLPKWEN